MNFREAIIALTQGKKITNDSIGDNGYLFLVGSNIVDENGDESEVSGWGDDCEWSLSHMDMVPMYEWLIQNPTAQRPHRTLSFYADENDLRAFIDEGAKIILRLDHTKILVDP